MASAEKNPTQFCLPLAAWSDWDEYHLESFYCSVDHGRQLHNRRCLWQKSGGAQKPESLGVWKVRGLKPSSLIEVYAYAYESAFGPQLRQIWTDLNQTWHKETVPQSNNASHIGRTLRHHAALQLFSLNVWSDLSPNSTAPFFSELDHKFVKQSQKPIFGLLIV